MTIVGIAFLSLPVLLTVVLWFLPRKVANIALLVSVVLFLASVVFSFTQADDGSRWQWESVFIAGGSCWLVISMGVCWVVRNSFRKDDTNAPEPSSPGPSPNAEPHEPSDNPYQSPRT